MYRYRPQRNWGCRIHLTTVAGIDAVVLENDRLRVTLLSGKGGDLVEFNVKRHDLDIAWLAPGGVRDPNAFLSTSPDPHATFLDVWPGGWQDIFPSAGEPSSWNGARYGQHGELSNMPWDVAILDDREQRVEIGLSVRGRKFPALLERRVSLARGEATLRVAERATNLSRQPLRAMWSQHICFGQPFLAPGSTIRLPDGVTGQVHPADDTFGPRRLAAGTPFIWPTVPDAAGNPLDLRTVPPRDTPSDLVYLTGFPEPTAWYEVRNPAQPVGVCVEWSRDTLPYLWYWQEFGGTTGYPWYGEVYTIGLEPNSSWPTNGLAEAVANDSALHLPPHGEVGFSMAVAVFNTEDV